MRINKMGKVWKRHLHRSKVQAARTRREKIFAVLQPEPTPEPIVEELTPPAPERATEPVILSPPTDTIEDTHPPEPEKLITSFDDALESESLVATPTITKPKRIRKPRKTRKTTVKKVAPLEVLENA